MSWKLQGNRGQAAITEKDNGNTSLTPIYGHATQKGWVLVNDRFKDEIEHLLKRRN